MLSYRHFWLTVICVTSVAAALPAFARPWTLASGETVEGEFQYLRNDTVMLVQDGREITIPLREFSADDRAQLREQVRRKRVADARTVRTWTDVRGRAIRASLLEQDQQQVMLLRAGRRVPVLVTFLSTEDREFLDSLADQKKADAFAFAEAEREPVTVDFR